MPTNPLPPWIPRNTDGMNNLINLALMGGGGGGYAQPGGGGSTSPAAEGRSGGGNALLGGGLGMTGIVNNLGAVGQNPFTAVSNWWQGTPVGGTINRANDAIAAAQSGVGTGINPAARSPWDVINTGPSWPSGQLGGVSPGQAAQPGFMAAYGGGTVGGGSSDLGNIRGIPMPAIPNFGESSGGGGGFWQWLMKLLSK